MDILQSFDSSRFYLGKLCPQGHEWENTGQSLRHYHQSRCVTCKKNRDAEYRKKNQEKSKEYQAEYREKNREKLKEYSRSYREANRDKLTAQKQERYQLNKDVVLEKCKEYRNANKEKIAQRQKRYHQSLSPEQKEKLREQERQKYHKNIEKERERSRQYRKNNPEKRAATQRNYRHSNRGIRNLDNELRRLRLNQQSDDSVTPSFLRDLFASSKRCLYCGVEMVDSSQLGERVRVKTLDHLIPIALNGLHTQYNVVVCCYSCNIKKGSKPFFEWIEELPPKYKIAAEKLYRERYGASPEQGTLPFKFK
jgi:hypothetical protein